MITNRCYRLIDIDRYIDAESGTRKIFIAPDFVCKVDSEHSNHIPQSNTYSTSDLHFYPSYPTKPLIQSDLTAHFDTVVGAIVVRRRAVEDIWDCTNDAESARIVLACAGNNSEPFVSDQGHPGVK